MPIHFTPEEFAARREATIEAMVAEGLDGLLMFRQESMYYLSGYDTFGYVYFQCLYLGADGTLTLLTRPPDVHLARYTSVIEDVRVWVDGHGVDPALVLRDVLDGHGCRGKRLGIEYEAYGLTGNNLLRVQGALEDFCALEDASRLVSQLRLVKSPAEMAYVRRAAELADDALDEAKRLCVAGAFEGDILAAMQGAVFKGGGDYPGNEFIIGSGAGALMGRYTAGHRHLDAEDQITLEFAGVYRHYHSCLMRTIRVGPPPENQLRMHEVALEAMDACMEAARPGNTVGGVFDAYAKVCDDAGFADARFAACGYCLGTTFAPNWMDWPMFYTGNPVVLAPDMVFFMHMAIMDSEHQLAVTPAHTVVIAEQGCQTLSRHDLHFIVN
jgi:Xaa-Pro dipeptidase